MKLIKRERPCDPPPARPAPVADQANAELERAKREDHVGELEKFDERLRAAGVTVDGPSPYATATAPYVPPPNYPPVYIAEGEYGTIHCLCGLLQSAPVGTAWWQCRCGSRWDRSEGFGIVMWVHHAWKEASKPAIAAEPALSASEALYGFAAWLTTRRERAVFSAADNAGPAAELVAEFCRVNGLAPPRDR